MVVLLGSAVLEVVALDGRTLVQEALTAQVDIGSAYPLDSLRRYDEIEGEPFGVVVARGTLGQGALRFQAHCDFGSP